jgi:nucleoid-associated protein YgaU
LEAAAPEGSKEYVVQKGDTLQKISMKFYDTHNKWNRIYEANKDILPNPNRIKPGVTIRIP